MLPDRCSVMKEGKQCVNPPEFVVSVVHKKDEYMIGVTCNHHKQIVSKKVQLLQEDDKIPDGKINFTTLKPVGTDCIKGNPDEFIHIDQ